MSETSQGLSAWLVFLKCTVLKTQIQLTAKFCLIDSHFGKNFLIFRKFINILILSNLYYCSFLFTVFLNPVSSLVLFKQKYYCPAKFIFLGALKDTLTLPFIGSFIIALNFLFSLSQVPKPLHYWIESISFSVYF